MLSCVALALSALPTRAQTAPAADPAALLASIETRYRGATGLRVRFAQRYHHRLHASVIRSRGTLRARPPSLVRFDFRDPPGRVALCDATQVTVFEPEPPPGRVYRQALEDSSLIPPVAILRGDESLAATSDVRILDSSSTGFAGAVLEIRPRQASRLWERMLLYVDTAAPHAGRVHRLMSVDAAGNLNRFDFSREALRVRHRDDVFSFTAPAGALIVEP